MDIVNWIDSVWGGGQVVVKINNIPSMRASASPAFLNPSVNCSNSHYILGILLLVVTASSVYPPITATGSSGYVISSIVATATPAYKINSLFSLFIGVGLSSPAFLTPLIPASPSPDYVDQVCLNSVSTYSFTTGSFLSCYYCCCSRYYAALDQTGPYRTVLEQQQ